MRSLLLLLAVSLQTFAQIHSNQPLPQILEKSAKVLDEGIIGWSLSLDGQWVSKEMVIPARTVAANEDFYEDEVNQLGLDNVSELIMYPTLFGNDTIYILVKVMETGQFKYKETKQKWQSATAAYYFVFDGESFELLKDTTRTTNIIKIPLRDYGSLGHVKPKDIPETLERNLVIRPKTDQILVASIKLDDEKNDKIFFQLSSQHNIFPEVEGIVKDFTLNGRTIYGTPLLTDYLHYEYDKKGFYSFFSTL